MKHYQQLNKEERFYIWDALRSGQTQNEVALVPGRHPSTICREIKRNKYRQAIIYTYYWALEMLKWRKRRVAGTKYRKLNKNVETMICRENGAQGRIRLPGGHSRTSMCYMAPVRPCTMQSNANEGESAGCGAGTRRTVELHARLNHF